MKLQKRLAGQILGCSPRRVLLDETKLDEIKEAITTSDIKRLISLGSIIEVPKKGVSRGRVKESGRSTGTGSRKGVASSRGDTRKRLWVNKVRLQRRFVRSLEASNKINHELYRDLYRKVKGGFFRSKRHISLYLEEKGILKA